MPAVNNDALSKLWSRIEEFFSPRGHTHSSASASAPGYMSAEDKAKLDGIDPEAAKVDVDSALSATSENPVQNKVVKAALDGKAASSHSHPTYANQNAFSHVAVGSVDVAADSATDTLTIVAGTNVTITADAANDKLTVAAKDTTYSSATQSAAGLMAAADKKKLDGVASGANNYTHPSSHEATMITQDATHRFATDTEKAAWNAKAPAASPTLTGTPKAPTAAAGTSTTQIATTAFVQSAVTASAVGHAIFQGTVSSNAAISDSAYKKGWYWVVGAAGTYVGQPCEPGDMVFANTDKGSAYAASHFSVVQNNIQAMTAAELDAILV